MGLLEALEFDRHQVDNSVLQQSVLSSQSVPSGESIIIVAESAGHVGATYVLKDTQTAAY